MTAGLDAQVPDLAAEQNQPEIHILADAALDAVSGGVYDNNGFVWRGVMKAVLAFDRGTYDRYGVCHPNG